MNYDMQPLCSLFDTFLDGEDWEIDHLLCTIHSKKRVEPKEGKIYY